jgi:hypothetical protein
VPAIPSFALNGGTPPVIVVPITNTGSVPLFVNSFELLVDVTTNAHFSVDYGAADACPGATRILAPGAHCNIVMSVVGYTSAGTVTGRLLVHGLALDGAGLARVGYGELVQIIN